LMFVSLAVHSDSSTSPRMLVSRHRSRNDTWWAPATMLCCEHFCNRLLPVFTSLALPVFSSYLDIYCAHYVINSYKVVRGGSAQSQYGEFVFADLIGHPYRQRFFSGKGLTGFVYPLRASPELLTSGGLAHRTQLVHSSDASYITLALQLRAGLVVVEA